MTMIMVSWLNIMIILIILVTMRVEPAPWSLSPGCLGRGTAADRHTFIFVMVMMMTMTMMVVMMKMIGIQKIKQIVLPVQFSSGSATARSAAA